MNLKHLLGRTGGLITAFALLASMVVPVSVAGAFYVIPTIKVTCYNCSAPGTASCSEGHCHVSTLKRRELTPVSVESVYGVHDIDGMTTLYQVGNEYWLFDMPSSSSDPSVSCVGYCPYKIKDILTAEGLIDSTKSVDPTTGSASVPVNVTREAATFSVVVPTTLPISVDADGNVTTATDATIINNSSAPVTLTAAASTFNVTVPTSIPLVVGADSKVTSPSDVKIINNSAGPVKVTAIAMNDGVWTMTDYNGGDRSKLAAEKVGSNKLGLSLTAGGNTVASSKNGSQSPAIDSTKWRITGKNTGNNGLPITVGAIASAVSTKIENAVTAANVVFTVAWDK